MLRLRNRERITANFIALNLASLVGISANTIFYRQMNQAIPHLFPGMGLDFSLMRSLGSSILLILFDLAWLRGRRVFLAGVLGVAWIGFFTFLDMPHFAIRHAEISVPQIGGLLRLIIAYLLIALLIDHQFWERQRRAGH